MNLFYLNIITSLAIVIPVTIGLIRLKQILADYYLIVIICMAGLLNELLSYFLVLYAGKSNAINSNIFILVEAWLFLWQFYRWDTFKNRKEIPLIIGACFTLVWIYDNLVWNGMFTFNGLSRIAYSFMIIFLSISQLTRLIFLANNRLIRNSIFLICTGLLVYFSYKGVIEVFYLMKIPFSDTFYNSIFLVLMLVNFFVNIILGFAILWIPKKKRFFMPF